MWRQILAWALLLVTTVSGALLLRWGIAQQVIEDVSYPPVEGYESLSEAGFPLQQEPLGSPEEVARSKQFRAQKMRAYLRLKNWSTPSLYFAACSENEVYLRKLPERRDDVRAMTILAGNGDLQAAESLRRLCPDNAYADLQWARARLARNGNDPEVRSMILLAAKKKDYSALKRELEDELRAMHLEFFGDRRAAWIFAHEKGCARELLPERDGAKGDALGRLLKSESDPERKDELALALRRLSWKAEAEGDLWQAQELAWVIRDHLSMEELHSCMGMDRDALNLWLDRLLNEQRETYQLPLSALRRASEDDLARMEVIHQYIGPNFAKHDLSEHLAPKKEGTTQEVKIER